MKASKKRGFTIVELIIVIAVIAILAAVLIPTFSNLIQKANEANDTALVRNLNSALIAEEASGNTPKTMLDVVDIAEDYGYNVSNLQTKADGYKLLWHQQTNRFYVQNGDKITTNPEVTSTPPADGYLYWEIADSVSDTHSVYLKNYSGDTVNTSKGIDLGNCTGIKTVNYTNTAEQTNVIIRTNSFDTTLNISGELDTVKHYDMLGDLVIEKIKGNSYHEFGKVNNVTVQSGRFVAEAGSEISGTVTAEDGAFAETENAVIWGAPTYVWADDYSTCTATRTDSKQEKTETETVEAVPVITKEATTTEAGSMYYTANFVNPVFGTQKSEDIEIPRILTEEEKALNAVNAELKAYENNNNGRKPETMHAAMESLSATSKTFVNDNAATYLWDSVENEFCSADDITEKIKAPTTRKQYEFWKITEKITKTKPDRYYSHYLADDYKENTNIECETGLDVGNNSNIKSITFSPSTSSACANAIFRTNGGKLLIEKGIVVTHYGEADNVKIVGSNNSNLSKMEYIEKGTVSGLVDLNRKNVTVNVSEVKDKAAARAIVVRNSTDVFVKGNGKTPVCYTDKEPSIDGVGNGNDIGKIYYKALTKFDDGFGTQNHPFVIKNAEDWSAVYSCETDIKLYFKLGSSFTIETYISTIPQNSEVVLDLNGHTITLKKDATIQVGTSGLTIMDSVGNGGITKVEVGGTRGLFASFADGANLTIESGNFTGNYLVGKSANEETSITITVNGGTFKVDSFISTEISQATVKIQIQGGSFNIDPKDFVDDNAYNVEKESNSWKVTKK